MIMFQNDMSPEAIEAAFLRSNGIDSDTLEASFTAKTLEASDHPRLKNIGLHGVVREILRLHGEVVPRRVGRSEINAAWAIGRDVQSIRAADPVGYSTLSLPGILSSLANKAISAAYSEFSSSALSICSETSTSDFKKFTRYRMTESGVMEKVGAAGELKHGQLSEESYENQVETYGKLLSIGAKDLANDDLSAFTQVARMLGRQGRHALEELIVSTLVGASTAAGAGTTEFFHGAARGNHQLNYLAGSSYALSYDALDSIIQAFANQTDSSGKPVSIEPAVMLVGSAEIVVGRKLFIDAELRSTVADAVEFTGNAFKGMILPVVSPYLGVQSSHNGTYFVSCQPTQDQAGISVAYLDGKKQPIVETRRVDLDRSGDMQMRGYFDFGVALQDPRAIVKVDPSVV